MSDVMIGRLLVDMAANTARLQADMREAKNAVGQAAREIQGAADVARAALGGLVAGISVGGLLSAFKAVVGGLDDLNDTADRTGASIERLSKLEAQLAPFGHSLDTAAEASGRLVRQMQGTSEESGKAAAAFEALKVKATDANGNLRDQFDVLIDVAKAFDRYADGSNKNAIALALFGRSASELAPLLKDLAKVREAEARVTTKQAEEAEKLNQAFAALGFASKSTARDLAGPIITSLSQLATQFVEARRAGLGFAESLATFAVGPNNSNQNLIRMLTADLDKLRARQATAREAAEARAKGGYTFGGTTNPASFDKDIGDLERRIRFLRQYEQQRVLADVGPGNMDARDLRLFGPQGLEQAPRMRDLAAEKKAADEAAREAEKLAKERMDLRLKQDPLLRLFDEEGAGATQKSREELLKWTEDQAKAEGQLLAAREAQAEARVRWVTDLEDQIKRQREANEEQGKTASQIEYLRVARLDDTIAIRERTLALEESIAGESESTQLMREEIARLKELRQLRNDAAGAAAMAEELKRQKEAADELTKSIDSLGLKFESAGENALVNFSKARDVVQGLIADVARLAIRETVTRPGAAFVKQGLGAIGTWATNAFGATGATAAQNAAIADWSFYGALASGAVPNALGNAFDGSGIVSSPTLFRFARGAGLMGEAGPEAIMPLKRGPDGSLGVAASGGAGGPQIVMNMNFALGVEGTTRAVIAREIPKIAAAVESSWQARRSQGGNYSRA